MRPFWFLHWIKYLWSNKREFTRGHQRADTILEWLGDNATFQIKTKIKTNQKVYLSMSFYKKLFYKQIVSLFWNKLNSYKKNTCKHSIKSLIFKIWGKKNFSEIFLSFFKAKKNFYSFSWQIGKMVTKKKKFA